MWSLYQQAMSWKMRPADLFGIPDDCDYFRWCFDEAVLYLGRWVEAKHDERHLQGANKGKRKYTLQQILQDSPKKQSLIALAGMGGVEIR